MARSRLQRSFTSWVGLASLLHLLIWAAWRARPEAEPAVVVGPKPPISYATELEVWLEEQAASASTALAEPASVDIGKPLGAGLAAAPSRAVAGGVVNRHPRPAGPSAPGPDTAREGPAPVPADTKRAAELHVSHGTASQPHPAAEETRAPATPAVETPVDRLTALGYGTPSAAALRPFFDVAPVAVAEERLNQNLVQAIVEKDRDRSMGIEGPVTNAIHAGAMSVVVPKSTSKIAVTIGRDGKLADFRILETNRDARALKVLGERVKRLLARQSVRMPGGRAMEFIYEVKSEVLLPSGRAPGLAVEVFGIPVKRGRDEKSSKISILTPRLEFKSQSEADPERNGKITQTPPQLVGGLSILGIGADAVDIGAPERQVVHTRLIQQRVL